MATTISAEIPFVDLKAQYATIREEVLAELADVLEGMQLFLGPRQRASRRISRPIARRPTASA
jgi:hypothetical protein